MTEPIAITGIGCRFPGAPDAATFWQLIKNGVDAITEMPADRFDAAALYDARPGARGKIVTRQGGFLAEVDAFDPSFFGISPKEAMCIDPQQRLLLEVAWEAIEDAGVTQQQLAGSPTGVFIGMWTSEYEGKMFEASSDIDLYVTTGGGRYAASGRVSHAFDLRGPSLTLDTACSSSLVAVHLACQSLWSGESEMALAGGVNLILEPHITIGYSRSAMLSADARCRFGDARASGYVRSEGVGLVLLKPLSRALADGDPIHALVRGSAVNNDGQGSGLLVAPSAVVQAVMLRQAYRRAGVEPGRVGYVEAHGTGTRVGDPVELAALGEVLGEGRAPDQPCRAGSVKTNIGHTEAASGIAGLIKAALCLEHRTIPPSLHFSEPSPRVAWGELPLVVARTAQPWPDEFTPAYAGVNSFGITGTNAHVVLEAAPARPARRSTVDAGGRPCVLPLSAKSDTALTALAERWITLLEHEPGLADLHDRLYTASVRRSHHAHRMAVTGATASELEKALRGYVSGEARAGVVSGRMSPARPRVVFVFPGMGPQLLGMGRALLATERVFREALERCEHALAPHVSWSLLQELTADADRSRLDRVDIAQPVLFAIEVALAAVWRAWGIAPDAVVGHSMGEVAAAHVAGALSLEDAARVITLRSRLLGLIAGQGAMAVVELSLDDARALISGDDRLCVAASNSARSTVLAGDTGALADLLTDLERRGVFGRRVKVDVAGHSPQVDALRADLRAGLAGIAPRATHAPFYSTVSGARTAGESLGAEYWVRNLREPVLFATALGRLVEDGFDAFVEMSPHPVLAVAVQEVVSSRSGVCLASGRRDEDERAVMLESLASLWTRGYPVDWARHFPDGGRVVALPGYPWQRERFWFEANRTRPLLSSAGHPFLATHVTLATAGAGSELWEGEVAAADHACLVSGHPATLSAGARLDAIVSAATLVQAGAFTLEDVRFPGTLELGPDVARVQLVRRADGAGPEIELFGRPTLEAGWTPIARVARLSGRPPDGAERRRLDVDAIQARSDEVDTETIDGGSRHRRPFVTLRIADGEALGRLHDEPAEGCVMHPEALDAGLWALVTALGASDQGIAEWDLSAIRSVRAHGRLADAAWVYAVAADATSTRVGDIEFLDETGAVVVELRGVEIVRPRGGAVEALFHRVEWSPRSRPSGAARAGARWLVVAEPAASVHDLVARLQAAGDTCAIVSPAQVLAGTVAEVLGSAPITGCVHLASIGVNPDASPTVAGSADLGWASVVALVNALTARADSAPPRLWLVTRGAQRVTAADRSVSLGAAALWGLGAAIAYEQPGLRTTRVDLGLDLEIDVTALAAELLGADSEDQIAVRGATHHAARLVRGAPAGVAPSGVSVSADGAYLITGGTGGLGLVAARWLVARGARFLTLMGRRAPTAEVMRTVTELRAAGAEVSFAQGDVTRRADVRSVVKELTSRRRLAGVIHAAGFVDDGLLANLDRARFTSVLATKVDGAIHLDEETREHALDFFVGFSSAIGVLGAPGQANYAAANAGLDGVVARRRAQGHPALSIAWGPWARVGIAAARRDRGQRLAARGLASLAPEDGVEALERLLATAAAHALVMRFDAGRWSRAYASGARSLLREAHAVPAPAAGSVDPLVQIRAAAPEERRALLEAHVREHVGQVLRIAVARIDLATPLASLGLSSLLSLELRNRLETAFGLSLPATLAWNYPTVAAVAGHLEERLGLTTPPIDGADAHVEEPGLERLLEEIQGLSDDEVSRLLAEGRPGPRE